jgi:hypothetical protein
MVRGKQGGTRRPLNSASSSSSPTGARPVGQPSSTKPLRFAPISTGIGKVSERGLKRDNHLIVGPSGEVRLKVLLRGGVAICGRLRVYLES